jgi:PAS domain S-box-containing protein
MTVVGDRFAQREGNNMPTEDKGAMAPLVPQPHPGQRRIAGKVASESAFKVLVIDQTTEDRASMRIALQAGGFVLEEATDAEHGLKLAASSKPDCILLGDVLPDARGPEVLESLRGPDGTLPCAVVMLAEVGSADVVSAAMRSGALDYLVKDRLDANKLRRAIGSAVRHFRLIEAQHTAERRNAQFAAIVAASDDAIISTDADFVIRTWNAGAERLFGYSETEARERTLTELLVPEAYEAENVSLYAILINGRTARKETLRRHKDGHLVPVEINTSPILDRSGRVIGTTIIYRDISERRRAEEARRALAESEARFRVTFENAPVGIAHLSPDLRWLRVNEAFCRISGHPADELTTKSLRDIVPPDDFADLAARGDQISDGKIDRFETDKRALHKDGTIGWVRVTVGCLRKSDGSIDYFVVVIEDISARKHAEEELRKSEERFRSSVLHSPVPILLFDDREDVVAVSQSWLDETGYSKEELRRIEDWTIRAHSERSDEALESIRQLISTERETLRIEVKVRTKDRGERLWNVVAAALGTLSDGRHLFISVAQDTTERKAHEERVQLLMREAYHRIKNLLGLVQAIARQSAGHGADEFIGRFTERIEALAANQDLLVQNQWHGALLGDLVRAQLAHFADLIGSRIAVHGPKLRLNASGAQAIGLALHELTTNAEKYGALSTDTGHVDVSWRFHDENIAMSWIERGGPPVQPPDHRGFGTTVVDAMVKQAVDGEVRLNYPPSGVEWHLTCSAANALEPPTEDS